MTKKVTQNVTNSNSEDLTNKWKKGELPSGYYYVKNEFGNIFPSDYSEDYDCISDTVVKDFFTEVSEIKEVLDPVPSYEEYLEMKGHCGAYSDINQWQKEEISAYKRLVAELKQENTKLKAIKEKTYNYDYLSECYSKFIKENTKLKEELQNQAFILKSRESEIVKLKGLLKECKPYLEYHIIREKHVGFTPQSADVLWKIKQILGEE